MFKEKPETLSILLSEVIDSDDSKIRRALEDVLISLSAVKTKEEVVGPVGSQVIFTENYKIGDDIVTVIEETYIGIEFSGPKLLALKVFGRICGGIYS